jgi:hypothetical protein
MLTEKHNCHRRYLAHQWWVSVTGLSTLAIEKTCIFPALDTRTKSNDPTSRRLRVDELLEWKQNPFPGLLFYAQNMPVVMLSNACTPFNGATGTAIGIVIDPTGK